MSTQLVVRMPDDLAEAIEQIAKRMARKRSDVVRIALQQFVKWAGPVYQREAKKHGLKYLGSLDTGIPDLAINHRKYVLEALKQRQAEGR